jgi:hypothetical protein
MYSRAVCIQQSCSCTAELFVYSRAVHVQQSCLCTAELFVYSRAVCVQLYRTLGCLERSLNYYLSGQTIQCRSAAFRGEREAFRAEIQNGVVPGVTKQEMGTRELRRVPSGGQLAETESPYDARRLALTELALLHASCVNCEPLR